jgi:uncharacterized membrane protein YkvA (DUF1232 family)
VIGLLATALAAEVTADGLAADLCRLDPTLPPGDARELALVLEPFVAAVPEAITWAVKASKDRRWGRAVAFGTGSVVHYLLDEDDLFPESEFGAVGLVDDAYLVHVYVDAVRGALPVTVADAAYEPPAPQVLEVVSNLLPDGVADALRRTAASLVQLAAALFAPPPEVVDLDGGLDPVLRCRAAVDRLGLDRTQPSKSFQQPTPISPPRIGATTGTHE